MEEIGKKLKAVREKQGFTLEELAKRTKIHISKLRAIENGDLSSLPAKVFAIGLIKSYARELKVDSEIIDGMCQEAFNEPVEVEIEKAPPPPVKEEEPTETQAIGLFQIPKALAVLIGLTFTAALVAAIIVVINKMESYSKEAELPKSVFDHRDRHDPPPHARIESSKIPKAKVETNEKKQLDSKKPNLKHEPYRPPIASEPIPEPVAKKTPPSPEKTKSPEPEKEPISSTSYKINETSDNQLSLLALEAVQIEVIWSDGYKQKIILKEKEQKKLIFTTPIKVRISNSGAVKINFNGQDKGIPGPLNDPIEISFP